MKLIDGDVLKIKAVLSFWIHINCIVNETFPFGYCKNYYLVIK